MKQQERVAIWGSHGAMDFKGPSEACHVPGPFGGNLPTGHPQEPPPQRLERVRPPSPGGYAPKKRRTSPRSDAPRLAPFSSRFAVKRDPS